MAVALVMYENGIHAGCGQPTSESMDPDGPDYSAEDVECRACKVLAEAGGKDDGPGVIWYVTKR